MSLNVELLRSSFVQVKKIAEQVADKFYEFLLSDYPDSQALFAAVDMKAQKKALINSLVYIVDHLDMQEQLVEFLMKLGERHVKYGTEGFHYPMVGASLLKTFAHFFGENWTDELNTAWSDAYGVIAEVMIKGAGRTRVAVTTKTRSNEFRFELPKTVRAEIQRSVALAFTAAVSEEVERAFAEELDKFKSGAIVTGLKKVG